MINESESSEAPPPPEGVEAVSGDSEVEVSWSATEGAATYNVYRSTAPTEDASGNPLEGSVTEERHTDLTARNGTTYYYRITAVSESGLEGAPSEEVEVTPFANPPDRPN